MATRSTIKIEKKDKKTVRVYHHCDGYPGGVGVELKNFLADRHEEEWTPAELAISLYDFLARKPTISIVG
jgi:hypothetical protein